MKEHKNIDRLFQEKFRDFEFSPPERIWSHVEKNIDLQSKSRSGFKWVWMGGVAVGLALLLFLNNEFNNSFQSPSNKEFTNINSKTQSLPKKANEKTNETESFNFLNFISFTRKTIFDTFKKDKKIVVEPKRNDNSISTVNAAQITGKAPEKTKGNFSIKNKNNSETTYENGAFEFSNNKKSSIDLLSTDKRWSVSTVAAPVYLGGFEKENSSIDPLMNENLKQGKLSSAYGVQVAYQLNKRFSVQSGVHMVDFAYRTNNIDMSINSHISKFTNINYNKNSNLLSLNTDATFSHELNKSSNDSQKGDLIQVYGYIEIPLEAKYRLNSESDLGINLIGGFSTLLLNKNEVYVEVSDFTNKLGEATNLNSLNFSGNFGVELEYKVYKNINFNLVPMFKIQTQTLNDTNSFKPYSIGLYSGLNLRF